MRSTTRCLMRCAPTSASSLLGEDVGRRGGVFRVTAGLLDEFGEERVIDTPLAESGIIGSAIGMALNGLRPIAEIQFLDFIHSAMDQIMNEAARIRYRSNNDFSCPIVIRVPFGGGVHGALYHSQSIEAMFVHTPGIKVVAPATPSDAKGLAADRNPGATTRCSSSSTRRCIARSRGRSQPAHMTCRSDKPGSFRKELTHGDHLRHDGPRGAEGRRRWSQRRLARASS